VCISIVDNGIGLPKNVKRLFEPYVTNRKEGTGLGLSIVKKIIEDHEGSLVLRSAKKLNGLDHSGAEVKIILPTIEESARDKNMEIKS
jgi:two-component system nitrogen regulation sensor histidine kinase NtrY